MSVTIHIHTPSMIAAAVYTHAWNLCGEDEGTVCSREGGEWREDESHAAQSFDIEGEGGRSRERGMECR